MTTSILDQITPVILTFNEEPNIRRSLERLRWASQVVVLDSFSTDATPEIARSFPNVQFSQRTFDRHATQWNAAAFDTGITTDWILALDADYILTDAFEAELKALDPRSLFNGFTAAFTYCVDGRPLRGTLYPPVTVLFRRDKGRFEQDGHTHRLKLDGADARLKSHLLHDDRKPLSHWLNAQDRYMKLEVNKLSSLARSELSIADRIRGWHLIAPFAVFLNCYVLKRGFLDGSAGLYYAQQRMLAETLLALRLADARQTNSRAPLREGRG